MSCQCGAAKTFGAKPGDRAHSSWCPARSLTLAHAWPKLFLGLIDDRGNEIQGGHYARMQLIGEGPTFHIIFPQQTAAWERIKGFAVFGDVSAPDRRIMSGDFRGPAKSVWPWDLPLVVDLTYEDFARAIN